MQKQPTYFRKIKQKGIALVFSLMAILLISLISSALIKSQSSSSQIYNMMADYESAEDATDFCVQAGFEYLINANINGTLITSDKLSRTFSSQAKVNEAYANADAQPIITRISNRNKIQLICSIAFIKQEAPPNAGNTGDVITASRNYGSTSNNLIKYYRIFSVSDNGFQRVEYHTVISI